ncbi:MAG: hypothetical protein JRI25_19600 [Deltaproteobacteria bacterium]|nr:hypothetical protein [Deltaproteobacteria bacterium]MBW2256781.1 hypothetical protein [Deltaproteobacteria bacterium]
MRRALPALLVLAGCSDPITNTLFYEEEEYLNALPSAERFAPPANFVDVPVGDDAVLAGAVVAAVEIWVVLAPLVASGEALMGVPADERRETHRSWEMVPVVLDLLGETYSWWIRATIVRGEGGAFTWTLDGAPDRIGPWAELAGGRHEGSEAGTAEWRLYSAEGLVDGHGDGVLDIAYAKTGTDYQVEVRRLPDSLGGDPDRVWGFVGDHAISWWGAFEVTNDGQSWPGVAVAVNTPEGGRAEGFVWRSEEMIAFSRCWDAQGDTVWAGGDDPVATWGNEATCVVGPILEDSTREAP